MISERMLKNYCNEDFTLIENYDKAVADDSCTWEVHHRFETHDSLNNKLKKPVSISELKSKGLYYKRPACELILLTPSDHIKIHHDFLIHNEKRMMKMREHWVSEEYRQKQHNIQSKLIYWNNGEVNKRSETCPGEGWIRGRLSYGEEYKKQRSIKQKEVGSRKEFKENHSRKMKGRHWFNNGEKELNTRTCPEGFVPGRLNK